MTGHYYILALTRPLILVMRGDGRIVGIIPTNRNRIRSVMGRDKGYVAGPEKTYRMIARLLRYPSVAKLMTPAFIQLLHLRYTYSPPPPHRVDDLAKTIYTVWGSLTGRHMPPDTIYLETLAKDLEVGMNEDG